MLGRFPISISRSRHGAAFGLVAIAAAALALDGAPAASGRGRAAPRASAPVLCAAAPQASAGAEAIAFGDARRSAAGQQTSAAPDDAVALAAGPRGGGYWLVTARGDVHGYNGAAPLGSAGVVAPDRVAAIVATPDGRGYWLASRAGGVWAFGDARYLGAAASQRAGDPIVAMAARSDGRGYWLVSGDGRVSSFGQSRFYGEPDAAAARGDIVAIAATPDGRGYWLISSSGGILRYGDARYFGSALSRHLHEQIVGLAPTADGRGYWLAASDGHVSSYGDAHDYGSPTPSADAVVSLASTSDGAGYWLLRSSGSAAGVLPPPARGFVPCRVTAIGDSVMLDVKPALETAIPGVEVDATVSRQWDDGVARANQLRSAGALGAIVVVDLGTNGPVSSQQFAAMMKALAGASRVIFVTVHLPSSYSWSASVNATLEAGVSRYPRARIADFNRLAHSNPQWFGADGVHLGIGGPGAQAMAGLIKAAL